MWQSRTAMIVVVSAICGATLLAQPRSPLTSMTAALAELESDTGSRAGEALDYVLAHLDMASAEVLLTASIGALQLKRIEDAGFLFYAGQLRSRVDQQRFPPVGKGGDSPAVAIGALQQIIGAEINPAIMREPATFAAVLNRLEAWDTNTARGYDPGWAFAKASSAAEARKVTDTVKAEYLRGGKDVLALITIPEYLSALRESQDAGQGDLTDETKVKAALERQRKALERLCEIEKKMKIAGLCRP
jgi:hypothetical protein